VGLGLEPDIRHAVLGNAATLIAFRVSAEDAVYLALEFQPRFGVEDLINLANRDIYLKLMIHGTPSPSFSTTTITTRNSRPPSDDGMFIPSEID
jgi:hypothetical protein